MDEASLSLKRVCGGGLGGEPPSLGTLGDMLEGSSDGSSLCEGLHKRTWGLLYRGTRKMRFLRDTKVPCRQAFLSVGTLLRYLEGVRLPGLLRDKKSISGFLFEPGGY